MKPQTVMTAAVAGGFGLLALFGVIQATDNSKPDAEPEVQVLVATQDIPIGVQLDESNVSFKKMRRSAVPPGSINKIEQYKLRALKIPAVMGETILAAKLGKPGEAGVSMTIPTGYRVVTLKVSEEDSFSSMLSPGDRVDLSVTFNQRSVDGRGNRTTIQKSKTLLEYLEVFAVDNRTFGGGGAMGGENEKAAAKVSFVSLLARPEEAQLFLLAKEKAKLHLTWRSRTDDADENDKIIDESILDDLNNSIPSDVTSNAELAAMNEQATELESELDTDLDFQSFLDEVEDDTVDNLFASQPAVAAPVAEIVPRFTMRIYNGAMAEEIEVETFRTPEEIAAEAAANSNGYEARGESDKPGESTGWFSGLTEKFGPKL